MHMIGKGWRRGNGGVEERGVHGRKEKKDKKIIGKKIRVYLGCFVVRCAYKQ